MADAIEIEKNELAIDAGACVACGACIAVCPTSALISVDPMEEELAAAVATATAAAEGVTVIASLRVMAVADPTASSSVRADSTVSSMHGAAARYLQKLGVKNGAGKMPTIEAERNLEILDAMSRIGEPASLA